MSLFTKARKVFNTLFKSNQSPQVLKETDHLLKLILAKNYLNIRLEACTSAPSKNTLENFLEEAIKKMEKEEIYAWNNRALRTEMNRLLEPEVMSLLQIFSSIDRDIEVVEGTGDEWDSYCQRILLKEAYDIKEKIENSDKTEPEYDQSSHKVSDSISNQLPFLHKKYEAIQKLASSEEWKETVEGKAISIKYRR